MRLTLTQRKTEVAGVESFIFQPAEPITWRPGQFLHYSLHHRPTDDRGSDRWFTVASAPFEKDVMITTRLANENGSTFKAALAALKVGETIEISDIDGDFLIDENPSQEYIFIAGGIGVTPFHSILKQADHDGLKLHAKLLYANRDNDIPYKEEFDQFVKNNPDLSVQYVISPTRIDIDFIKTIVPDMTKPIFYVSGPEPMVEALGNALKAAGVPELHLKQDWFPGYPAE
jgi:ferredoxin-NADP reductase